MSKVTDRMVEAAQEWMRERAGYLTITDAAVRGLIEAALRKQPAPDYERGFVDGMSAQARSSIDLAVNSLYAHPPQRKPLTDEEIHECFQQRSRDKVVQRRLITRAIERAHGIGGEK